MKYQSVFYFSFVLFLSACSTEGRKDIPQGKILSDEDSITVKGFEVEVVLSKKARQKLERDHETIIVQAYLSGTPSDSTRKDTDEMGQLTLGSPAVELDAPGVAKFGSMRISANQYRALSSKDFEVLINVFSGRKSSRNNLLEVEFLQEPLHVVQKSRHVLRGKLIGEN